MQDPSTHYKDRTVAETYDEERFSSLPGRVFNALEKSILLKAFRHLPADTVILDVPCGTGRLAEPLLEAGYRVHGMDISDDMLAIARRKLDRFEDRFTTQVADAKELAAGGQTFRGALCARVLMHFPLDEQIQILKGVASVVTDRVVINQSLDTHYQRLRRRAKGVFFSSEPTRYPITNTDIRKLLAESGLCEEERYRMPRLISEAIYVASGKIPDPR